ncbi:unnamed protein product, partial [Allacma fusca]
FVNIKEFSAGPITSGKNESGKDGDSITTSLYATFGPCGEWDPAEPGSAAILKYLNLTASLDGSSGSSKDVCFYKMHGMINGNPNCVKQKYCFLAKFGIFIASRGIRHMTMSQIPGPTFGHLAIPLTSVYMNSSRNAQSTLCNSFGCQDTENKITELNQLLETRSLKNVSVHLSAGNIKSIQRKNIRRNDVAPGFWIRLRDKIAFLVDQVTKHFTVCSFGLMCDLGNRVRFSASRNQQYHNFKVELLQILESIPGPQRWSGFEVLRIATMHGFDCRMFSCPLFNLTTSEPAINPRVREPLA